MIHDYIIIGAKFKWYDFIIVGANFVWYKKSNRFSTLTNSTTNGRKKSRYVKTIFVSLLVRILKYLRLEICVCGGRISKLNYHVTKAVPKLIDNWFCTLNIQQSNWTWFFITKYTIYNLCWASLNYNLFPFYCT